MHEADVHERQQPARIWPGVSRSQAPRTKGPEPGPAPAPAAVGAIRSKPVVPRVPVLRWVALAAALVAIGWQVYVMSIVYCNTGALALASTAPSASPAPLLRRRSSDQRRSKVQPVPYQDARQVCKRRHRVRRKFR